uniref:Interferon regulatory factor 5 n=2 Tax=Nothoprocta TaxID=8806 RepID=A0A8C7EHT8_NOTPE
MSAPARRVRLRPWLVAQVDSGRYPGLRWLDPQRRLFCIPWRHATRHAPQQPHGDTIFKAWAQETGKFTAGLDEPDPAKWKATLRCALNKSRDFRLRYDGSRDAPRRPYRVYELCGTAHGAGTGTSTATDTGTDTALQELTSLSIAGERGAGRGSRAPPRPLTPPATEVPEPLPPLVWPEDDGDGDGDDPFAGGPPGPALAPEPLGALGPPPGDTLVPNLLLSPHMLPRELGGWRGAWGTGVAVGQRDVGLGGWGWSGGGDRGGRGAGVTLGRQRRYTQRLLGALGRGLLLELRGQDLAAVRLCQCKVFWTGPCAAARPGPNPLPRDTSTKLFSLQGFLNGLIRFQKGQTATPPPFEILLCFGEEWPDHKPKEKKLITVQVVPVAARLLLELFSGELSWSADSVPLHISPPDLEDRLLEQFKELHALWQGQQRPPPPGAVGQEWGPPPPPAPWGFSQG